MKPKTCEEQILAITQALLLYYQQTATGCKNSILPMVELISSIEQTLELSRDNIPDRSELPPSQEDVHS
jgi:hypothetical protein